MLEIDHGGREPRNVGPIEIVGSRGEVCCLTIGVDRKPLREPSSRLSVACSHPALPAQEIPADQGVGAAGASIRAPRRRRRSPAEAPLTTPWNSRPRRSREGVSDNHTTRPWRRRVHRIRSASASIDSTRHSLRLHFHRHDCSKASKPVCRRSPPASIAARLGRGVNRWQRVSRGCA